MRHVGMLALGVLIAGRLQGVELSVPEGNLIVNPEFSIEAETGRPADWDPSLDPAVVGCVSFADGVATFAPTSGVVSLQQRDLQLAEGGRYRIGLWVKTRNFKPARCSALVYSWAWTAEGGIVSGFPSDTRGEWVRLEKEFTAPESRLGLFVFTVYVKGNQGEFAIRSPWLVPVDDRAKAGARPAVRDADVKVLGRLRPPRPANCTYPPERQLNVLVQRLRTGEAKDGETGFSSPRDGWIWIALERGDRETKAFLDGREVIRFREGERFETLRRVAAGDHVLRLTGAEGGAFVVNEVPQTLVDPYPQVYGTSGNWRQYGCRPFQGTFRDKYLNPITCAYHYGWGWGSVPKADKADLRDRGIELVSRCGWWGKQMKGFVPSRMEPPEHMAARFLAHEGQSSPDCAGTAYDEVPMETVTEKWNYAKAMRLFADASRVHYTWSSGNLFTQSRVNAEYLASCLDASQGRGFFLFESYPRSTADEAGVAAYLDGRMVEPIRRAKRLLPGCEGGLMTVMALYDTYGDVSYNAWSAVDTKRFYELYVRQMATDPTFAGLGGVGLYAYDNGSEEAVRWISKVFRHYLLEGNTELLSDRYGYAYRPDFLKNGDFADGLAGWTASVAPGGAVEVRKVNELGRKGLCISGEHAAGNTAAVFRRSPFGANVLTGRITGLKPGSLYSFRYGVGDVKGLTAAARPAERRLGIDADLTGVELVTGAVALGRYGQRENRNPYFNYRQAVFKAVSTEAEVSFSDTSADNGEELSLNAVAVKPYFAE